MESLFFQDSPEVEIATNKFINVPTILQWEDEPLLQVGKFETAGYTTKFAVFHSDGTKIAYVKGIQVYPSTAGLKATVKLRSEPNLTACELEGRTIFELRRAGPGQLKGWAEIYAPEGVFIKATDAEFSAKLRDGTGLPILDAVRNGVFDGQEIAIHITKQNGIKFGGKGGRMMRADIGGMTISGTGGGGVSFIPGGGLSLHAGPGGDAYANTTSKGMTIVRGAIGEPTQDPPPSGH